MPSLPVSVDTEVSTGIQRQLGWAGRAIPSPQVS